MHTIIVLSPAPVLVLQPLMPQHVLSGIYYIMYGCNPSQVGLIQYLELC